MDYMDRITLLDRHEVAKRLGIGVWTFGKLVKSGQFPRAIEVAPNSFRWSAATVAEWVKKKEREPRKQRMLRGATARHAQREPSVKRERIYD